MTGCEWTGELREFFRDEREDNALLFIGLLSSQAQHISSLSLLLSSLSLKCVLATDAELLQSNGPGSVGARG